MITNCKRVHKVRAMAHGTDLELREEGAPGQQGNGGQSWPREEVRRCWRWQPKARGHERVRASPSLGRPRSVFGVLSRRKNIFGSHHVEAQTVQ